ncbi:hypothetical protein [Pontibacillus yanchengensis]|nr:hypothetical protein [Pontibacillus yanchengensis]
MFTGGFFIGKANGDKASRVIEFGYQHPEQENRIDTKEMYSDIEHQSTIDNIMMILMAKEKITNVQVNSTQPDIYLTVKSPKKYVGLISSSVWFTDEGAIIGPVGEDQNDSYYRINKGEADYIKEKAGYDNYQNSSM